MYVFFLILNLIQLTDVFLTGIFQFNYFTQLYQLLFYQYVTHTSVTLNTSLTA